MLVVMKMNFEFDLTSLANVEDGASSVGGEEAQDVETVWGWWCWW